MFQLRNSVTNSAINTGINTGISSVPYDRNTYTHSDATKATQLKTNEGTGIITLRLSNCETLARLQFI